MDPSGLENNDKTITWGDDYAQNSVESKTCSYRCSFCRRGFSNAQALGGHMNIHRKDRAKLREFSDENLLSLDITKNMDYHEDHNPPGNSSAFETKNQDNIIVPLVKDNLMLHLPLFADDDHEKGERFSSFEKKKMELISHGEVDLELRLGFEPSVANTD